MSLYQHKVPGSCNTTVYLSELKENLASVFTQRGGGKHDHTGNILLNAQYDHIEINKPHVIPPDPGPMLVITIGLKEVQLANLVWAHIKYLRERKEWLNIGQSVKKKMQEALPPGDINGMQELHRVFQNTQAWDLLAHVIAQFPIGQFMISEKKAQLKDALDASALFGYLVERCFKFQEFASDAGRPVDNREITSEVYAVIYHT